MRVYLAGFTSCAVEGRPAKLWSIKFLLQLTDENGLGIPYGRGLIVEYA